MKVSITNIITLIRKIIKKEEPILLGRWNIDYNKKTINIKIDSGNYDHSIGYTLK